MIGPEPQAASVKQGVEGGRRMAECLLVVPKRGRFTYGLVGCRHVRNLSAGFTLFLISPSNEEQKQQSRGQRAAPTMSQRL